MGEFLKLNPQLKKIELKIQFDEIKIINHGNFKYVRTLNFLHTLDISATDRYGGSAHYDAHHTALTSILNEIHAGDIPLQHLHVRGSNDHIFNKTDQLVDSISELNMFS